MVDELKEMQDMCADVTTIKNVLCVECEGFGFDSQGKHHPMKYMFLYKGVFQMHTCSVGESYKSKHLTGWPERKLLW